MFRKILIANRGEIAARVLRCLRAHKISSAVVYSDADKDAPYLKLADEAIHIGPSRATESYLVIEKIIEAAKACGAEAIHPGYGFLSENAKFSQACKDAGIQFIGPSPEALRLFGDKAKARELAAQVKAPTIPGSGGPVNEAEAKEVAAQIGFPLMVKAAGGGGGMGMEIARDEAQLVQALARCSSRGAAAFSDPRVYIERAIEEPRHIEVQVLFDRYGNGVALGERECSIQRRYQKVIEETPSVAFANKPALRQEMFQAALSVLKAGRYEGAGTVEFLLDKEGRFYFIEVNARLQVEHPVTEWVTGLDLVWEQICLAAGEPLSYKAETVSPKGAAIECRIYAEDPQKLLPKPGTVSRYQAPVGEGIRVDDWIADGVVVSPYYDPLVAKITAFGEDRATALSRLKKALQETVLEGLVNNIPLHLRVIENSEFVAGEYSTQTLPKILATKP